MGLALDGFQLAFHLADIAVERHELRVDALKFSVQITPQREGQRKQRQQVAGERIEPFQQSHTPFIAHTGRAGHIGLGSYRQTEATEADEAIAIAQPIPIAVRHPATEDAVRDPTPASIHPNVSC